MSGIKLRDHKLPEKPLVILMVVGFLFFGYVVYYASLRGEGEVYGYGGETMGTTYSVKVRGDFLEEDRRRFEKKTEAVLEGINGEMSTWREDSLLSRFNEDESLEAFEVSESVSYLLDMASVLGEMTGGAYDVTAGSLFHLWGWSRGEVKEKPSKKEVREALRVIGMDKLERGRNPLSLRKKVKGVRVDLSSIAKGYGVDRVGKMLEEEGVVHYLVEIGGEVRVRGRKGKGVRWRVAVEAPKTGVREVDTVWFLEDMSMATSGDYRNFFEEEGKRYAHIFDLETGYPVKSRLASVTVIAGTTALADGLATALFASGEERAKRLVRVMGFSVLLMSHGKEEGSFERWLSPAMETHRDRVR